MDEVYAPSEDSFFLSETLKKEIKNKKIKVLEIGSGSGIQLETLYKIGIKKENIFSVDINPKAVELCRKKGFNCIKSDLFLKVPKIKFDLIVFNPPYLPENEFDTRNDTTGGKTGSETINRFLAQAKSYLKKNGEILLLTSSFTEKIKWNIYRKKLLAKKKLFFEEIYIWKLTS